MDLHLRLKELCKSRGTSIAALESRLGMGNGTIGKWWKNGRVPNYANLSVVANALETTISYLTGETDDPSAGIKKDPIPKDGAVGSAKQKLLDALDGLSDSQIEKLIGIIEEAKKTVMKDYIEIDGKQVQLQNLALVTEYPFVVDRMKQLEEEKVRAEKKARLYF